MSKGKSGENVHVSLQMSLAAFICGALRLARPFHHSRVAKPSHFQRQTFFFFPFEIHYEYLHCSSRARCIQLNDTLACLHHLRIASEGCGQLRSVVPSPGPDWRFLLSIGFSLTQPPDGTGQPALQQTSTHFHKMCIYHWHSCHMSVTVLSAITFRVFPVPETLRFCPGDPTAPPGGPPTP